MDILIFSRNRPLQLHGLLLSIKDKVSHCSHITVLHRYDEEYASALEEIKAEFPDIDFQEDEDFKGQVLDFLGQGPEFGFFLVDDGIFRKPIDLRLCESVMSRNQDILTFSLRMGLHLNYCYTRQRRQRIPRGCQEDGLFIWRWKGAQSDWGYPFSVDGHTFQKRQLLKWCKDLSFSKPNTFEVRLQKLKQKADAPNLCVSGTEAFLVNIPLNRVQSDRKNKHENLGIEFLLEQWNSGLEIDIKAIESVVNTSCHYPLNLPLRNREQLYN